MNKLLFPAVERFQNKVEWDAEWHSEYDTKYRQKNEHMSPSLLKQSILIESVIVLGRKPKVSNILLKAGSHL